MVEEAQGDPICRFMVAPDREPWLAKGCPPPPPLPLLFACVVSTFLCSDSIYIYRNYIIIMVGVYYITFAVLPFLRIYEI